jgi:hypothetical protein
LALDVEGNLYYLDQNDGFSSSTVAQLFEVFPTTATGNVAPASSFTAASYNDNVSGYGNMVAY